MCWKKVLDGWIDDRYMSVHQTCYVPGVVSQNDEENVWKNSPDDREY